MERNLLLWVAFFFCLIGSASATTLEFESVFPACAGNHSTMSDFSESLRCSAYFLVPNLHFESFNHLVLMAVPEAVYAGGESIIDRYVSSAESLWAVVSEGDFDRVNDAVVDLILIPFTGFFILYGIISSVFVYVLLIMWEFLKTYLIVGVSWSLWSTVLFGDVRGVGWITSPGSAIVVSLLMVAGSILLLFFDVTVWGVI